MSQNIHNTPRTSITLSPNVNSLLYEMIPRAPVTTVAGKKQHHSLSVDV